MQTIQLKVSNADFQKYKLGRKNLKFTDLVELINTEYARKALLACNGIADEEGFSKMTIDEIDAEIRAVRDAKTYS